jgi:hypothetical protein
MGVSKLPPPQLFHVIQNQQEMTGKHKKTALIHVELNPG